MGQIGGLFSHNAPTGEANIDRPLGRFAKQSRKSRAGAESFFSVVGERERPPPKRKGRASRHPTKRNAHLSSVAEHWRRRNPFASHLASQPNRPACFRTLQPLLKPLCIANGRGANIPQLRSNCPKGRLRGVGLAEALDLNQLSNRPYWPLPPPVPWQLPSLAATRLPPILLSYAYCPHTPSHSLPVALARPRASPSRPSLCPRPDGAPSTGRCPSSLIFGVLQRQRQQSRRSPAAPAPSRSNAQ